MVSAPHQEFLQIFVDVIDQAQGKLHLIALADGWLKSAVERDWIPHGTSSQGVPWSFYVILILDKKSKLLLVNVIC